MKWYDPEAQAPDDIPIEVQAMIRNYNSLTFEAKLKVMEILQSALDLEIEMMRRRLK